VLSLPLNDQSIGMRLTMDVEIEDGALIGVAQIQIAARQCDLISFGGAGGDDLA
jgi:hypothetical protein